MKKSDSNASWVVLCVLALLVGLIGGAYLFPTEKVETVYKNITVNITVPGEPEIIYKNVTVEKEVEVTIDWLKNAVDEFLEAAEDEEDEAGNEVYILECGDYEYDFDEISVSKVYDAWQMNVDDEEREVIFDVRLKYKEDDERSCRATYGISVFWEEDEDTIVEVLTD